MIATITPQSSQQTNFLAAALNGTTSSLSQALNNAIQRSQQDVELQAEQGAAFLSVQAQRLARQQEETFDLRNRAENTRDFQERQDTNNIVNDGRVQNQEIQRENQDNILDERNLLSSTGNSPAQRTIKQERRNDELLDALRAGGADKATLATENAQFERNQRDIATKTNSTPADNTARREAQNAEDRALELPQRQNESEAQASSDEAARNTIRLADVTDFEGESDEKLIGAIRNIDSSSLSNDPQLVQVRERVVGILGDRGINLDAKSDTGVLTPKPPKPLSSSEQTKLDNARFDVEALQKRLDADEINEEDEKSEVQLKLKKAQALVKRLSAREGGNSVDTTANPPLTLDEEIEAELNKP